MSRIKIRKRVKTEKKCLHNEQVEDADNYYYICTECGVQLQQVFHRANNQYEVVQCNKNNIHEFIDNCARRLNLPECMSKEIFDHFMKLKVKKGHKNAVHLASYSIYSYLILAGMARKLSDIVDVKKVHRHDILKYSPQDSNKFNDVKDILENMPLIHFKLTEADRRKLMSISNKFLDNGNSPYSIAGALTQIYSSFIKKKIAGKIITAYFKISSMTLSRAKNLIEKEVIAILETNIVTPDEGSQDRSRWLHWSPARRRIFESFYSSNE